MKHCDSLIVKFQVPPWSERCYWCETIPQREMKNTTGRASYSEKRTLYLHITYCLRFYKLVLTRVGNFTWFGLTEELHRDRQTIGQSSILKIKQEKLWWFSWLTWFYKWEQKVRNIYSRWWSNCSADMFLLAGKSLDFPKYIQHGGRLNNSCPTAELGL